MTAFTRSRIFTSFGEGSLRILRIVSIIGVLSLVVFVGVTQQVSNDFWLQAKIGEMVLSNHSIPATLYFPFTEIRDSPFNSHEWLASVLFYLNVHFLGESSLPFVSGGIECLLFVLVVWLAYKKSGGNLPLSLVFGLLAIAAENYRHILRPELLSLLCLVVCLNCLRQMQEKYSRPSFLIYCISTLVWANTHGSVILAPILVAAVTIGEWLDRRLARMTHLPATSFSTYFSLLALTFLCTFITPSGVDLWRFVIDFSQSSSAKSLIIEWIPTLDPRVRSIWGVWIGLTVMCIGVFFMWRSRKQLRFGDVFIFFIFATLGIKAVRFLVYIGIALAYSASYSKSTSISSQLRAFTALALMIVGMWCLVAKFGNAYGVYPFTPPDEQSLSPLMIRTLSNPQLQGNVFVSYDLGAELIYRSYPRLKPSIDSRVDSYGDAYFWMHEALLSDRSLMSAFLNKYAVRFVLVDGKDYDSLIRKKTLIPSEWRTISEDYKAILLERISIDDLQ